MVNMKIYAIRHGQTDWNKEEKIQGRTDIPLNETGILQAEEAAENFKNKEIAKIYSSPLVRAVKTAEIINEKINVSITPDVRLIERDFGDYEGLFIKDSPMDGLRRYTGVHKIPNGETFDKMILRIFGFLDEVILPKQNILLVTHGHVLRVIDWYFKGIPKENEVTLQNKNCQIYEYEVADNL
jgi:broad specificity phosphatase PhoE